MKQFLQKSMVTRLLTILIAFFMITSIDVIAQTTHSVSSTDNLLRMLRWEIFLLKHVLSQATMEQRHSRTAVI